VEWETDRFEDSLVPDFSVSKRYVYDVTEQKYQGGLDL